MKVKYFLIFLILCVFNTNAQLILKYKNTSFYYYKSNTKNVNSVLYNKTNLHPNFKTNVNETKKEFETRLIQKIKKNLDLNLSQDLNDIQNLRQVDLSFVITKKGKIEHLKISSKHKNLIKNVYSAIHNINGITNSSATNIFYDLVVSFNIKSITQNITYEAEIGFATYEDSGCLSDPTVPFSRANKAPKFKNIETKTKKEFDKQIQLFITKNYNPTACLFLDSGKHKIYIQFVINKNGLTKDIKVKAPNKTLEKEIINAIKKLPQFIPGKQRNKLVEIRYNTIINFKIEE